MQQPILTISPRPGANGYEYQLHEDFEIQIARQRVVVPRLFTYDGATIPVLAWRAFYTPFDPVVMGPSLVHDWLYSNHQVEREEADSALFDLWLENGVPKFTAQVMLIAVKQFGDAYWKNTEEDMKYLRELYDKHADNRDRDRYKFPPL